MTTYEEIAAFWKKQDPQNAAELETLLNGLIIAMACHSGKIENGQVTYLDTREIFECGRVSSYIGDWRTLFELRYAKTAMQFF